jgi:hypothetical protein
MRGSGGLLTVTAFLLSRSLTSRFLREKFFQAQSSCDLMFGVDQLVD